MSNDPIVSEGKTIREEADDSMRVASMLVMAVILLGCLGVYAIYAGMKSTKSVELDEPTPRTMTLGSITNLKTIASGFYAVDGIRVIDGDTVEAVVDLGFNASIEKHIRLFGINTPEIRGEEREEGLKSKAYLESLLKEGRIILSTGERYSEDRYGRTLGILYVNGTNVNQMLVEEGYAETYEP